MSTPTYAVVTTCYDRWGFLERTLPSWRRLSGEPEVFIGTYARDDVPPWLSDVHVVSVDAEPFHLTRLRNCVAAEARRAAGPEYLLFMDADIEVSDPDVFARALAEGAGLPDYVLDSPFALAPEYLVLRPEDPERTDGGKRGTAMVRTDVFFDLGGYDQRLKGWGMDDRNLYQRLGDVSDRVAYYDRDGIVHLEHSFELRYQHNPGGTPFYRTLFVNLKKHVAAYDLRGGSWADDFGYPDAAVRYRGPRAADPERRGGAAAGS